MYLSVIGLLYTATTNFPCHFFLLSDKAVTLSCRRGTFAARGRLPDGPCEPFPAIHAVLRADWRVDEGVGEWMGLHGSCLGVDMSGS